MCDKQPYATRTEANHAAAGMNRKLKQGFKHYVCPDCGAIHLTSVKKKHLWKPKKEGKYKIKIQDYTKN